MSKTTGAPRKPRGRSFEKGNSGRPLGARNRSTVVCEAVGDDAIKAMKAKAIQLALSGDPMMLRFFLGPFIGPPPPAAVRLDIPEIKSVEDARAAANTVMAALNDGRLTHEEAAPYLKIIDLFAKFFADDGPVMHVHLDRIDSTT